MYPTYDRYGSPRRPGRGRRSTALLALLACLALIAAACAEDDGEPEAADPNGEAEPATDDETAIEDCDPDGAVLRVTYPGRLGPTLPAAAEALEAEHEGLTVELSDSATTYTDNLQQIVADEAAGMVPDVVMASTGQVAFYVDALGARTIDEALLPDTYDERFLIAGEVDGSLHAVPLQISMPIVIWNQDLYEEAGLDPEQPPETNSEVLEHARQIDAEVEDVFPAFYPSTIVYDWFFQNMLHSAGGEMTDAEGNPAFASDEGVTALEPWSVLHDEDLHAPASGLEGVEIFTAGEIGFVLGTNAVLAQIDAGIGDGFEWSVAPAPVPDGGERDFAAGGNALAVLAEDDCQAQFGQEFIAAAITPETQAGIAEETGYIPVDTEARQMLADFYEANPQYAVPVEYDGELGPWISFRGERSFEASEVFQELLESVAAGADRMDALEQAEDQVRGILGREG